MIARLSTPARDEPDDDGAGKRVDSHADAAPNRPTKLSERHHGREEEGKQVKK